MTTNVVLISLNKLHLAEYFPRHIHPQADEIGQIVSDISDALNIRLPHYHNYQTMAHFIFPRTSADRLVALSLLSDLLYYIDDLYDRHKADPHPETRHLPRVFKQVIKIFCQGEAAKTDEPHTLYDVALALHHHFLTLSNPEWFQRFADALAAHLLSTTQGTGADRKLLFTDAEHYFCLRELDGGIWTTMYSIEFANNDFLPPALYNHAHLHELSRLCGRIATLSNDLFSYEKEVVWMGSDFNLLVVLMQTEQLTFEQAVERAINAINADIAAFMALSHTLPDFGDDTLNQSAALYVQGLRDLLSATWYWQMDTDRYRSSTSPFAELRTEA